MKLTKAIILIASVCGAVFAANAQKGMYKLDVGDFSELKVSDGINVEYYCSTDSAGWAFFECDPATAQMIMFTNKKNGLTIQIASDGAEVKELPTIKLYSMTLQKVENSGDSLVTIQRTVPVREFKGSVVGNGTLVINDVKTHKASFAVRTGNGHLVVNGTTRQASLRNVGTGKLEASGLMAEDVKCNILGTGPIDCNASVALSVSGAGSGKVFYGGTPSKISNHSIGVKVISVDTNQVIN
ncbi:MAG: DUF2807 domain-containing protein [Muribaculaceae bacterium]|nr:DUF2807 domain-containing protein [Muribaculaceae bacterium]MDE7459052.1 DUF2807 domain-containing protein [Muribaculaceae bacterium]